MLVSTDYLKKLVSMREAGLAQHIKTIVLFDSNSIEESKVQLARDSFGIRVLTLDEIREAGRNAGSSVVLQPHALERDDVFMLNYTSGTTGDSKGVKISHWGLISSALILKEFVSMSEEDVLIDYLPAPHGFDQFIFALVMFCGASMGYY